MLYIVLCSFSVLAFAPLDADPNKYIVREQ